MSCLQHVAWLIPSILCHDNFLLKAIITIYLLRLASHCMLRLRVNTSELSLRFTLTWACVPIREARSLGIDIKCTCLFWCCLHPAIFHIAIQIVHTTFICSCYCSRLSLASAFNARLWILLYRGFLTWRKRNPISFRYSYTRCLLLIRYQIVWARLYWCLVCLIMHILYSICTFMI